METEHKTKMKERMDEEGKNWTVEVVNTEDDTMVSTEFTSGVSTFENVLHKIELDLMTNLHFGFVNPIQVKIKEREVKE